MGFWGKPQSETVYQKVYDWRRSPDVMKWGCKVAFFGAVIGFIAAVVMGASFDTEAIMEKQREVNLQMCPGPTPSKSGAEKEAGQNEDTRDGVGRWGGR